MLVLPLMQKLFSTVGQVGGVILTLKTFEKQTDLILEVVTTPDVLFILPYKNVLNQTNLFNKFEFRVLIRNQTRKIYIGFYVKHFLPLFYFRIKTI